MREGAGLQSAVAGEGEHSFVAPQRRCRKLKRAMLRDTFSTERSEATSEKGEKELAWMGARMEAPESYTGDFAAAGRGDDANHADTPVAATRTLELDRPAQLLPPLHLAHCSFYGPI